MSSMSDTDLMDAISTCCMTKQTLQARNAELYCTKQDTGTKLKARQYELIIRKPRLGYFNVTTIELS